MSRLAIGIAGRLDAQMHKTSTVQWLGGIGEYSPQWGLSVSSDGHAPKRRRFKNAGRAPAIIVLQRYQLQQRITTLASREAQQFLRIRVDGSESPTEVDHGVSRKSQCKFFTIDRRTRRRFAASRDRNSR